MMKYLNLSEGFNPYEAKSSDIIKFEAFTFSGGEPHIKIEYDWDKVHDELVGDKLMNVRITHRIHSFNDLGLLCAAVDALRALYPIQDLYLFLPYFPGARQDRRMVDGEPLTVKIYADIINSLNFDVVEILDSHSDVAPALLNNCVAHKNHEFVEEVYKHIDSEFTDSLLEFSYLISPDAGSNKKIIGLAKSLQRDFNANASIVKCDKERDVTTGKITSFEVYAKDLKEAPCIIVDDICDGGGTFLGLAKALKSKNAGDLYLVVTHGIFSKGFDELDNYFKRIYTTDSFKGQRGAKTIELKLDL